MVGFSSAVSVNFIVWERRVEVEEEKDEEGSSTADWTEDLDSSSASCEEE